MQTFGTAYYPEHRDRSKWEYDLDLMADCAIDAIRIGEFAWSRMEPRDGAYDFAWLDDIIHLAGQRGIRTLLCPPMRTPPPWLVERDPEMSILRGDGVRLDFGSRYTVCINNALLQEKGLALAGALAIHYRNNEHVLGWHLDNEYGDEPDCHCETCRLQFHQWLSDRYKSIGALNRAWGTVFWGQEYDKFEQAPTPGVTKAQWNPAHILAWRRFRSDSTVALVARHTAAVRAVDASRPVTTNFQGLYRNLTDFHKLSHAIDVAGTNLYPRTDDVYPNPHTDGYQTLQLDAMRGFTGGRYWVLELRSGPAAEPGKGTPRPGQVENLALQCAAHGAEALYWFRWKICPFAAEQTHGAVTGYDGKPTRVTEEVARAGKRIAALRRELEGTNVVSEVALLYDYETRFAFEHGYTWPAMPPLYRATLQQWDVALRRRRINVDAIGAGDNFSRYTVLVVPQLAMIDDAMAAKLRAFVEGGGRLVLNPLSGTMNEEMRIYPERLHPELAALLGVSIREFASFKPDERYEVDLAGRAFNARYFADRPVLDEQADALAVFSRGWMAGEAALTRHAAGKGLAYYVAAYAEQPFVDAVAELVLTEAGVGPLLEGLPEGVEAASVRSEHREILFLINHTDRARRIRLDGRCRRVEAESESGDTAPAEPNHVRLGPDEVIVLRRPVS